MQHLARAGSTLQGVKGRLCMFKIGSSHHHMLNICSSAWLIRNVSSCSWWIFRCVTDVLHHHRHMINACCTSLMEIWDKFGPVTTHIWLSVTLLTSAFLERYRNKSNVAWGRNAHETCTGKISAWGWRTIERVRTAALPGQAAPRHRTGFTAVEVIENK